MAPGEITNFGISPTLGIFMTTACNMNCRYCSSSEFKKTARKKLTAARMKRGVDRFMQFVGQNGKAIRKGEEEVSVFFTGAEPMTELGGIVETTGYIRRKYGRSVSIGSMTNGTLLDKKKYEALNDLGIALMVSLDGPKKLNDSYRRFLGDARRSVYDEVVANLRRFGSFSSSFMGCSTLTPRTIPMLNAVAENFSRLGFRDASMGLDLYDPWSPESLAAVRGALRAFKAKYGGGAGKTGRPPCRFRLEAHFNSSFLEGFFISAGGNFYLCDYLATIDRPEFSLGDIRTGIDAGKILPQTAEVRALIRKYPYSNVALRVINRYFYSKVNGMDTEKMVGAADRLGRIFHKELRARQTFEV